ncbi:MAG: 3-deoxy-manno-octulosonate cytidylyltransferase [Planctomycetota bacterium]
MAVGVVPARLGSTRLARKALAEVAGRPLVAWVLKNAARARSLREVLLATDDAEIAAAGERAGFRAILTDAALPSGTDRIAQAARRAGLEDGILVNIQGDEPEIPPSTIDAVVELLENRGDLQMATAACVLRDPAEFASPHRVKVVTDEGGRALYFSRAPIPHRRDPASPDEVEMPCGLGHLGIYAYRRDALDALVALPPSPLEKLEQLEQLRALQAGMGIGVALVAASVPGIDTAEDLEAFRARVARGARGADE